MLLILCFLLGIFGWSFCEYALHNWYGHKAKGKNKFSREHLTHHSRKDYFTSTTQKIITAVAVLMPMAALLSLLFTIAVGISFTLGLASGYLGYEWMHRRTHTHAPGNFYGRWARKHHFYHHFCNPKKNHGVTSPIWDIVFGTYENPKIVRVPEKMAMHWLYDENSEMSFEYVNDYVIVQSKRKAA